MIKSGIYNIEMVEWPPSNCHVSFNPYDAEFSKKWHEQRAAGPMWEVFVNDRSSIIASTFDRDVAKQFDTILNYISQRQKCFEYKSFQKRKNRRKTKGKNSLE